MNLERGSKHAPIILLLAALALGAIFAAPYAIRGAPSNAHDIGFHLNTWLELSRAFAEARTYPQWAEGANFNLGEPRFVFYPPISLVGGAILIDTFPLRFVPGIFILLCGALAALSMWKLASRFVSRGWALAAAALYVLNPYLLLTAYIRGAYAELLLAAFAPLVIVAAIRATEGAWRWTAILAVTYGLGWMTNLPGALLLSYALVGLAAVLCFRQRSWRSFVRVIAGLVLGFGVAASFIGPLLHERAWVQSDSVKACPTCVQDNFLFSHNRESEPQHQQFNRRISLTLSAELALAALVFFVLLNTHRFRDSRLLALMSLLGATAILLFRPSLLLWRFLPKLQFVQFPWRVGFLINCALVLLVIAALQTLPSVLRISAFSALVLLVAIFPWLWIPAWAPMDFSGVASQFSNGYEGVMEYAPTNLNDVNGVPRGLPPIDFGGCSDTLRADQTSAGTVYSCGQASALLSQWNTRERTLHIESAQPTTITLLQYWFPTWKLRVNGKLAAPEAPTTDQPFIRFEVPAGASDVQLVDETTTVKKLSRILSAFSLLVAVIIFARDRRSEPAPLRRTRSAELISAS
jgi:hypothetical protein